MKTLLSRSQAPHLVLSYHRRCIDSPLTHFCSCETPSSPCLESNSPLQCPAPPLLLTVLRLTSPAPAWSPSHPAQTLVVGGAGRKRQRKGRKEEWRRKGTRVLIPLPSHWKLEQSLPSLIYRPLCIPFFSYCILCLGPSCPKAIFPQTSLHSRSISPPKLSRKASLFTSAAIWLPPLNPTEPAN